jgi:hypothetical protein
MGRNNAACYVVRMRLTNKRRKRTKAEQRLRREKCKRALTTPPAWAEKMIKEAEEEEARLAALPENRA